MPYSSARYRQDAIAQLESGVRTMFYPRFEALCIAVITTLISWGFSALLWHSGFELMVFRYPLAVALSYPFFVLFLWLWCKRADWSDQLDVPNWQPSSSSGRGEVYRGGGGEFGGGGASGSWEPGAAEAFSSDAVGAAFEGAASAEELAPVAFVAAAAFGIAVFFVGLLGSVVTFVWGAPSLLATLMLDAGMASALYVYARDAMRNVWIGTVFSRTLPGFIGLAMLFAAVGFFIQHAMPEVGTLREALLHTF